jgi:hypothetical protein
VLLALHMHVICHQLCLQTAVTLVNCLWLCLGCMPMYVTDLLCVAH